MCVSVGCRGFACHSHSCPRLREAPCIATGRDRGAEQGDPTSSDGLQLTGDTSAHISLVKARPWSTPTLPCEEVWALEARRPNNVFCTLEDPRPEQPAALNECHHWAGASRRHQGQGPRDHQSRRRPLSPQDVTSSKRDGVRRK